MDILSKLFGTEAKVRIMRLFMFNPEQAFGPSDISARAKVPLAVVKRETHLMRKMGMIKGKSFSQAVSTKKGKKVAIKKIKVGGWALNSAFPYLLALQNLLINTVLFKEADIIRRLNTVGRMKLVIVAGVFTRDVDSRVDLLIVGDNLRGSALENVIRGMESEIGKELRYAAFETEDFKYRLSMHDKLVRDILDYPHLAILDRIGLPHNA